MTPKIINTRLGKVEFISIGKGTPVLFIHGGHSNCNETLCHKGFDLEKFQLITPSRPRYGGTPLNNGTPKQAADLFVALLDSLEIEKFILYGISAGGLTAIELASNYPKKVSKLILASAISNKWLNESGSTYKVAQIIFNPKIEKITWGMVKLLSKNFPNLIAKNFYGQFSKQKIHQLKKHDVKELFRAIDCYSSKKGFLNDLNQNIADETITKIQCPTLIVHSENDNSVPFTHALHAHKTIEGSEIVKLDNEWGHLFWIGKDSHESISKTIEFILK